MSWETFSHEADVGVRGCGATRGEAFAGAAMAMMAAICDPARVAAREAVSVACSAPDEELLLVDWLNALVYEMATRRMLFSRFEVDIQGDSAAGPGCGSAIHLTAKAWGEPANAARHRPAAEVKGASYCELAVRQRRDGLWLVQCIVDV